MAEPTKVAGQTKPLEKESALDTARASLSKAVDTLATLGTMPEACWAFARARDLAAEAIRVLENPKAGPS